jgi:predicted nucleotidyltransferase component of viral defense system
MRPNFYKNVLRPGDLAVLEALPDFVTSAFYLAGGTGLAFHLGHRFSHDLDFFSGKSFRNDLVRRDIETLGTFDIFQDAPGTLEGVIRNTRVTFIHYAYPMVESLSPMGRIRLASVPDIAAMKLSALSSRGSRKDFIDLFFIKERMEWPEMIGVFEKKYRDSGSNLFHVIKSLAWFDDAEKEPMPMMIKECSWDEVKTYFIGLQNAMMKIILSG